MTVSLRALFSRQERPAEFISIRNALHNHFAVSGAGLRELNNRFTTPNTTSGFDCGCRDPSDFQIGFDKGGSIIVGGILGGLVGGPIGSVIGGILGSQKEFVSDIGQLLPAWVHAVPRDHRDRPRVVEGILRKSRLTREDFPLKPWHSFYDWNYFVEVDQQYKYLLNEITARHHTDSIFGRNATTRDIIECEWDSAFVPFWALPPIDSRIWVYGRWIFDCGHPEGGVHRLEIHPPKATAWFRSEAALFDGNSGPTRANNAVLYIGRRGGYYDQAINDEDYAFDVPLPPRPHPDAVALGAFEPMTQPFPVNPRFIPLPERDPQMMRVFVPLEGASTSLEEYGAVISAGWSDPAGTEVGKVKRYRVVLEKTVRPTPPAQTRTWLFLVAVNGRWHRHDLHDPTTNLDITVELDLHEDDRVQITACGFEIRNIFNFMGDDSNVDPRITSERRPNEETADAAGKLRDRFLKSGLGDIFTLKGVPLSFGNDLVHHFLRNHQPGATGRFIDDSEDFPGPVDSGAGNRSYALQYRIEEI